MNLALNLMIFLPLISGVINGLFARRIGNIAASIISSVFIITTAICAFLVFVDAGINKHTIHIILFKWLDVKELYANWGIYVDPLTAIMVLLVTSVSCVVHIYSVGYMADDSNLPKFLSYLSLFTFFMLSLVSADNFLQLFFGWEGVGMCSYLLIGYYYYKDSANAAAMKAFIVNRVGDFAFIIGILLMIIYAGSLDFEYVFTLSEALSHLPAASFLGKDFSVLDVICLMLFIGCMGKSAQIGLHVWLPDAMEGPTPVSALIHAATMVTAGVFVLARCSFMFEYSQVALSFITMVGAVTCLFAALIAIAQTDIKKIIAYSTCSQLGYMFFACGVSAYQAGIFHLFTHGFFKALLFLSAGSVIHATCEQDITKMGGLWRKMPFTYANFWLGSLAIIGIFPLAGFYSKDLVLESAYASGHNGEIAFYFGIVAALLTAIYSIKIIIMTFHGETRLPHDQYEHAHEAPLIMNAPLVILMFGTIASGMIGAYILDLHSIYGFFSGAIFNLDHKSHHVDKLIEIAPLVVGMTGIILGLVIYGKRINNMLARKAKFIYYILKNKFLIDELFDAVFVRSVRLLSVYSASWDKNFVDRFGPNATADITKLMSRCLSGWQTGYIFHYASYMVMSLILCLTFFIVKYLQVVGV